MHKFLTINALNIVSVIFVIVILSYRKQIKIKLRHLNGSGRLTEIRTLQLRREYCLIWVSIIFVINLMEKMLFEI
jgi:hypothetical protein